MDCFFSFFFFALVLFYYYLHLIACYAICFRSVSIFIYAVMSDVCLSDASFVATHILTDNPTHIY